MANEATGGTGRSKGERTIAEDTETLTEQIESLKADLAGISQTLAELLKDSAREGRRTVEDTADYYMREGKRQADAAVESAREYGEALESQIARNPFSAVLVALGLGFLVGLMSRR